MIEVAMEKYLTRIIPNLEKTCVGVSPEEIDQIEKIAGEPLPLFYRWFLSKMGRNNNIFSPDYSVQTILKTYAEGDIVPESGLL